MTCSVCTNVTRIYGSCEQVAPWLCTCKKAKPNKNKTTVQDALWCKSGCCEGRRCMYARPGRWVFTQKRA